MNNINRSRAAEESGNQSETTPPTHLAVGLKNLWRTRSQSDIVVNVQDKKLHCHKAVLMAASPYFEAMFNSGMQEATNGEIHFKDMDANTFELVLEFIYTSKDVVSPENGCALLEAASLLQIKLLFEKCEVALSCNITVDTCLNLWRFASVHSAKTLRDAAFEVILGQFQEFVKQEDFMTLNSTELLDIIQDDRLEVTSEKAVVEAVIAWGNYSELNKTEIGKVFANLRLCQLSHEHIYALKRHFSTAVDSDIARKALDKALELKHVPARRQATSSIMAKYRKCDLFEEVLVLVGGEKEAPTETDVLEVLAYSLVKMKWFQLKALPRPCGEHFAWCSDGESIFITGGYDYQENGFLEYSGLSNQWKVGPTLGGGRYGHAMIAMSDALYVLGGCFGEGADTKTVSTIERYIFGNATWEKCGNLYQSVLYPSTSVSDNRIFLLGGSTRDNESIDNIVSNFGFRRTTMIQCFDTTTNDTTIFTSKFVERVIDAVQVDCATYIADFNGNIGNFEFKCGEVKMKSEMLKVISRNPKERNRLVQKEGKVIVTYSVSQDGDHLKQMFIINPETGEECMPPVLYPYPRTVWSCGKLTVQKKYLTKEK